MTSRWMPRFALRFAMSLIAGTPALAWARDGWVNPETMGANALPTPYSEPPWTRTDTEVMVGAATQRGRRFDYSVTPTFRLAAPFGRWVTAYFEGAPLEAWW